MSISRPVIAAVFLALALAPACADIAILGADTAPADVSGTDAASVDGSDSETTDIATNDVVGNECLTDFDCLDKIQGKTPCISAKCSAGYCQKIQKATGVTCKDSSLTPGDCGQTTCDAAGQCVVGNAKDGTVCGAGLCGKKCAAGSCIAATDADYDDGNPCTKDFCNQGIQVKHEPITDLTVVCDDKDACTSGDTCIQGACKGTLLSCADGIPCTLDTCTSAKGCAHTPDSSKCDDGNPCSVDGCDLALGCTVTSLAVGVTCSDGNECTVADACDKTGSCAGVPSDACKCAVDGDCLGKTQNLCIGALVCQGGGCVAVPGNAVYCDASQNSACLQNGCDPGSGKCVLKSKNEGAPCDDGNACTSAQTCQTGVCQGAGEVNCDDKNACTNDLCVPQSGCVHEANIAACDDGNACTTGDLCAKGGCSGAAKPCDDSIACTLDSCDKASGQCAHATDVSTCDDGNPCTSDTCAPAKGCVYANNDAAKCDDENACTANACQGGTCTATPICACKTDGECDDKNPCTADSCIASTCQFKPADGGACDPADKCQNAGSGVCGSGVCKGGNSPKDCSGASDACHSGACDPGTGQCGALPKGDGTLCDADKDPCTVSDACVAGACVAGKALDCGMKSDGCNVGVCKTNADGAYCTAQAKEAGTGCEDGAYCTQGDTCDGAGTCVAGAPQTCGQASDACNAGLCDEAKKACGTTPKSADVGCDDGQFCTPFDHCDGGGKCVGEGATSCPGTACAAGTCDPVGQQCVLSSISGGTACNDGDPCTFNDTCDGSGACLAGQTVACPGTACSTGYCDPVTGGCGFKPLASTTACDDGQKCTSGDHCDGYGVCAGGTWDTTCGCNADAMCDDGNACTTDSCDLASSTCQFKVVDGQVCDDGDACTTASTCNTDGACVAAKLYDCSAFSDTCHVGQCATSGSKPFCKAVALADGAKCDDGLYCTTGETCATGKCGAGSAVVCGAAPTCFTAACTEAALGCSNTAAAKGTACSDGEFCTVGDTCDGTGVCQAGSAMANFAVCDDDDKGTSGDLCLNATCAGFTTVTGASGPVTRIAYDNTGDTWWFSSALYSAPSIAAASKWSISQVAVDAKGGWDISKLAATQNGGPIRALSPQVAGGANNFTAFHVPGSKTWVVGGSSAFGKNAASLYAATTEWYDVDFRTSGATGHSLLTGFNTAEGAILGRCQGAWADTTSAWTCDKSAVAATLGVGAAVSFYNPLCFPIGSCGTTVGFLGALEKWNGSFATQLDTIAATGATGAWSALNAGPNFKVATSLPIGGVHAYDTSYYTVTGGSLAWAVGPSGSLAYIASGSSVLKGAALYGTNYQFTAVTAMSGFVLVWGYKTDTLTGALVPVLLTHADTANLQADSASWVEHDLALPAYDTAVCVNSAFSSYGMAKGGSSGTTLALAANYCGNTAYSNPPNLRGMIYVRK